MPRVPTTNPANRRDVTGTFGEKCFPRLLNRIPPAEGITSRVKPTTRTTKSNPFEIVSPLHAKRMAKNGTKLIAMLEFTELRNSPSYKHVFDMVGDGFPIHPEYLHVINIILEHYGVEYYDIIETMGQRSLRTNAQNMQVALRLQNRPINLAFQALCYVLYFEYQWNPMIFLRMFNDITVHQFQHGLGRFLRDYDRSDVFREDYKKLHVKLLRLEPLD